MDLSRRGLVAGGSCTSLAFSPLDLPLECDSPSQHHPRRSERYQAPIPRRPSPPIIRILANVDVAPVAGAHWVVVRALRGVFRDSDAWRLPLELPRSASELLRLMLHSAQRNPEEMSDYASGLWRESLSYKLRDARLFVGYGISLTVADLWLVLT